MRSTEMPHTVYHWRHDYLNVAQRDQTPASMSSLERAALSGHLSCPQCSDFFSIAGTNALQGIHDTGIAFQSCESGRRPINGVQSDVTDRKFGDRADRPPSIRKGNKLRATAKSFIPQYQPLSVDETHHLQPTISDWNFGIVPSLPIHSRSHPGSALTTTDPRDSFSHLPEPSFGYPLHASADMGILGEAADPSWTSESWPNVPWQMWHSLPGSTYYQTDYCANQPFLTQGQH